MPEFVACLHAQNTHVKAGASYPQALFPVLFKLQRKYLHSARLLL